MKRLTEFLKRFRENTSGTFTVEAVIAIPLLFLAITITYEFFQIHAVKSSRIKATYTISDILSRERTPINDTYVDNLAILFDEIANDRVTTQLRVSLVRYLSGTDSFAVEWSEVRGTGPMEELETADIDDKHNIFPAMSNGEYVIVIQTEAEYEPIFPMGFRSGIDVGTYFFSAIRFSPKIDFEV